MVVATRPLDAQDKVARLIVVFSTNMLMAKQDVLVKKRRGTIVPFALVRQHDELRSIFGQGMVRLAENRRTVER